MRKSIILALFLLISLNGISQIWEPVSGSFHMRSKGNNEYEIVLKAIVEEHSHIYAMNIPEGGPIPTTVQFEASPIMNLSVRFMRRVCVRMYSMKVLRWI
jgi:hypothetical protein